MGEQNVAVNSDEGAKRAFTKAVLRDLQALELMLERGMLESGVQRVGFEQEMFLVDASGHASPSAYSILDQLSDDPRFQSEVALFNLEANLGVHHLRDSFLSETEAELASVLGAAREAAAQVGADVVFSGTLPTLRRKDVTPDNLTPEIRYQNLNRESLLARGGTLRIAVDGIDRFEQHFDSVVIEGANTSIQLHLQIEPARAARLYNIAQLILAPMLAAASNSPVFLGKRVWPETRVAIFERALDDRSKSQLARNLPTRVGFGSAWLEDSLLELFHDNVSRYSAIVTRELDEDPVALVEAGEIPRLAALSLHNGTVWRWNRPCYGITDGKAHLRIENRILPSGPTVLDEIANAALFYGLMLRLDEAYGEVRNRLSFSDARANFLASATSGLDTQFRWLDDRSVSASELLLNELIPFAREGLASVNVPDAEIARYLDVIEERVTAGQTGSRWLLDGLARVPEKERPAMCLEAVRRMRDETHRETPVHRWDKLELPDDLDDQATTLNEWMVRDVFTIKPDDIVDLAASVMRWKHIRHIPVEDNEGRLVGLLGTREVLRLQAASHRDAQSHSVREVMIDSGLPIVAPDLSISDATDCLLDKGFGCLLVVRGEHLIGIVTERDLLAANRKQNR